ncbi:MAG: hypothetical protein A2428_09310 [Bdellovibrionales bacterium RIFOXYC1_FULL_54_43]|nr:MAG: hypothetical protein A2428_09310 [Bdellovibrionales bacterium RIFOXYC1_FULL_54_43]OFZ80886.1 MAG: hypothetical protein A2603_08200 [Bdellovibrionales bacterium RIFOXYD1_FULL_55_31]
MFWIGSIRIRLRQKLIEPALAARVARHGPIWSIHEQYCDRGTRKIEAGVIPSSRKQFNSSKTRGSPVGLDTFAGPYNALI